MLLPNLLLYHPAQQNSQTVFCGILLMLYYSTIRSIEQVDLLLALCNRMPLMVILFVAGGVLMDLNTVGKRIRVARLAKGWTQEELAEKAGISPTHVSVIERAGNSVKLETFVSICCALGVSADDVLQDLVPSSVSAQTAELEKILRGQPQEVQRTVLRVVRALIESE